MVGQSGLGWRLRREQLAHNPNVLRKIRTPTGPAWERAVSARTTRRHESQGVRHERQTPGSLEVIAKVLMNAL